MLNRLRSTPSGPDKPEGAPPVSGLMPQVTLPPGARTAATIRAELDTERERAARLGEKADEAGRQSLAAQAAYDTQIQASTLGKADEPDQAALEGCLSRAAALRRLSQETDARAVALAGELAPVELAEAIANGQEKLPALIAHSEARLQELERALIALGAAESALFSALYDESGGLKAPWPSDELRRKAVAARFAASKRAREIAQRHAYVIHPDFHTDGVMNLGDDTEYVPLHHRPFSECAAARRRLAEAVTAQAAGGRDAAV